MIENALASDTSTNVLAIISASTSPNTAPIKPERTYFNIFFAVEGEEVIERATGIGHKPQENKR
jgi:hypothetical protein